MLRYVLSWLGRILLIIAAAGIWNMKNWGRNLALVLLVMHILVLPWKHPPAILENSMTFHPASSKIHEFIQQVSASEKINFYFLASIFLMLWDLMVNAVLIFFLTRENVKKQFS